jgi:SAM-dependent methyltransferase
MMLSLYAAGVAVSSTGGPFGEMTPRSCPVCGDEDDANVFAEQKLDQSLLDENAFASRKAPEHMRLRLVSCPVCDVVYASPLPSAEALAAAYDTAAFESGEEARYAARSYAEQIGDLVDRLPDRDAALDIGTGEGAFLHELLALGFNQVTGVEPSSAPIAAADPAVRGLIEHGIFEPGLRRSESQTLITCLQTIEHIRDPAPIIEAAVEMLKPGGTLVLVCHDRRAFVNRALGLKSPIVDIEHMQLFSPRSASELLSRAGLEGVGMRPIRNRYPIRYWARLAPIPSGLRDPFDNLLERSGVAGRPLTVNVGNLLVWGTRA